MPIYEYFCPDNRTLYRFLARTASLAGKTPVCPENKDYKMEKRVSSFAFVGATDKAKREGQGEGDFDMDDPRMERAMMEMEREMASMDEENPDPRQLGQLMRKMSEMTGERLDGEMDEMVRRLEAGEDPEKLEEIYGEALGDGMDGDDDMGMPGGMPDEAEPQESNSLMAKIRRQQRRRAQGVRVDTKLYDMSEYLPNE